METCIFMFLMSFMYLYRYFIRMKLNSYNINIGLKELYEIEIRVLSFIMDGGGLFQKWELSLRYHYE
jgi:hypothetical protein